MALSLHLFSHARLTQAWSFDAKAPMMASAAVSDKLIVVGTRTGQLVGLDPSGTPQWLYETGKSIEGVDAYFVDQERVNSIGASPVIADVDRDGTDEILACSQSGTLHCLDPQGKPRWTYECGSALKASALVADINMDGDPEILVGTIGGKLLCLSGKGKLLFEYIVPAGIESVPGLLNQGKKALIIFGDNAGTLHAITPAQESVWRLDLREKITAQPAFFTVTEEQRLVVGTVGGALYCVSEHGERVWTYKTEGSIYSAAHVEDLDDDGVAEIIFGSCDNKVYALAQDGKRLWTFETDFWVATSPLVTDLDGDGKREVVAGSYDQVLYVLDGLGTYALDYVPGLSGIVNQAGHYTNILTSEPGEQLGKKLTSIQMDDMVMGLALIEHRTHPLILVTTKDGKLVAFEYRK